MDIQEWCKRINKARRFKFQNIDTPQDELLSLYRQVSSLSADIAVDMGIRKISHHPQPSIQNSIVSIMLNVFFLCDLYNVDIEKELTAGEHWFLTSKELR